MNPVEEDKNGISRRIQVSRVTALGQDRNKGFRKEIEDQIREKRSKYWNLW